MYITKFYITTEDPNKASFKISNVLSFIRIKLLQAAKHWTCKEWEKLSRTYYIFSDDEKSKFILQTSDFLKNDFETMNRMIQSIENIL